MTLAAQYKRERYSQSGLPMRAKDALALAQYRAKSTEDYGWTEHGEALTREQDGFSLRATTEYDEFSMLPDMGLGTFDDERGDDPWAVHWRHNSRGSGDYEWYHPSNGDDLFRYYRKAGASKQVADEWTRAANEREAAYAAEAAEFVITVTASRAGVELGRASIGGYGFDPDDYDRGRQLAAAIEEHGLADEAIADARETLAALRSDA